MSQKKKLKEFEKQINILEKKLEKISRENKNDIVWKFIGVIGTFISIIISITALYQTNRS